MELSNTAYVVLGALDERPSSGYEIKRFADDSIRLFWAVGFAQLYPELKRLTDGGLIEAEDAPTGGRRRTIYRITDLGREALADWVSDTSMRPQEVRDEMMVRLFFSDAVEPQTRIELATRMADRHRHARASIEEEAATREQRTGRKKEQSMHDELKHFGIAFHSFMADSFDGIAHRLADQEETDR